MGCDAQLAAGEFLRGMSGGDLFGDELSETGNVRGNVVEKNICGGFSGGMSQEFNSCTHRQLLTSYTISSAS